MEAAEESQQGYAPEKKKSFSEDDKRRQKIVRGSLLKAVIRPGVGEQGPGDGDQVIYHCTVRTLDGVVVDSTTSDFGGKETPIRVVLCKSKLILGLLEGILSMCKWEVAMVISLYCVCFFCLLSNEDKASGTSNKTSDESPYFSLQMA